MDNQIFKKAKLTTAIALVTSTTLLGGCLVEGDKTTHTSTTSSEIGNNSVQVNAPKGLVIGTVVDTNGMPVVGAKVYAGSKSATTGTGGTYQLENVPVSNLEVTDSGSFVGGEVRISIVPPNGYLGAMVKVQPTAVIDDGRSDQGTNSETLSLSTSYFIDGFTAVAGDAVLPQIGDNGATVTGVLRDDLTGEAIAGKTINLELSGINGSGHTDGSGDAISYTSVSYPATTDNQGRFTISGVPNDSNLEFISGGYAITEVQANAFGVTGVVTNDEVETVHVGNVYASRIANDDTKQPYVVKIDEVSQNASRGKLHDDATNQITIRFSEALDTTKVDANSVTVRDLNDESYITVTSDLSADGRSLTLTSNSNFNAGTLLDIYLLKVDFQDTAGNFIEEDASITSNNNVKYDYDNVNGNADYLKLQIQVYRELNQNAEIVTNESQYLADDSAMRLENLMDNHSSVFSDVDMAMTLNGVQQLNSADDDDASNGIDTKERLSKLALALDNAGIVDASGIIILDDLGQPITSNLGLNSNFDVDVARISFTPSNAAYYRYWVANTSGQVTTNLSVDTQSSPYARSVNTAADFTTPANDQGFGIIEAVDAESYSEFSSNDIVLTVDEVAPGDVIYIQSMDDFGNTGSVASLTLSDNIPATVGLQDSYGELDLTSSSTVFGIQYGNGGELANPEAENYLGLPLLNVNAGMLADHDAYPDATPSLDELFEVNTFDTDNDDYYIDPSLGIYDATAYQVWSGDLERRIAVSFTEDIHWVNPDNNDETKPSNTLTSYSPDDDANALLSDWIIMNDITIASDGDTVNADLVSFIADDIFQFANEDGQSAKLIDFTGTLKDDSENVSDADAKAKVVVNDAMPPVLSRAVYTGDSVELTFNEPVKVSENTGVSVITLGGNDIFLNADTIEAHNSQLAADRYTLTIPFTDDGATNMLPLNRATAFALAKYNETSVSLNSSAPDSKGHAALVFDNVQDDFGNTWADDNTNLAAPIFAAFDSLGAMSVTVSPQQLPTGSSSQTFVFDFTHAIDVLALTGVNPNNSGSLSLDGGQVANFITLTGAASIDVNNTSAVISSDRKRITLSLQTDSAIQVGQELDFNSTVESLWDSVDNVSVPTLEAL